MPDVSAPSRPARRLLAVVLPRLATDRLAITARRRGARLPDAPLVVVRQIANAPRLVALDAAAERLGLTAGLPLADARARVPHLAVAQDDPAADAALLSALASWCERWTPFVALCGPGDPGSGEAAGMGTPCDLVLDITGCAHLFGGEAAMLQEVLERLRTLGLAAAGAVAATARAARTLARWRPGARPAAGEEQALTDPLPVAALELPEATVRTLIGLGLTTLEAVRAQPRAALAARFGDALTGRLDELAGHADPPVSPLRPVPLTLAERRFAEPMADMETALKVLGDLARELCLLLEKQGRGARRLEAAFFRSDGAVRRIPAATARPVRDAARMAGLFREKLAALADPLDPGFGFDVLRLSLLASEPLAERQESFTESLASGAAAQEAAQMDALVDILSARLGAHRVMRFAAHDTHIPEAAARAHPALAAAAVAQPDWPQPLPPGLPAARPLTLFEPPEPVEALAEVPDGPPLRFRWRRALHEVARAEGPERIAPEWWQMDGQGRGQAGALTRDYFRVEDTGGRRFWLYREGLYGREAARPRWFLHGLFA
ncbi:DNA polymerase Y family protein [Xanthobacter tagetidis]|uniref:DNA polymerase Y family protein n=1 Tax=Xanthobacter tagetidis TaxID=60216 RepID=UPI001832D870|nr:DNA polymerase Y family protein [Xanthobacter tagetidis]MBB6307737.1 protein ImuB [Xanthobacter tagetidis]